MANFFSETFEKVNDLINTDVLHKFINLTPMFALLLW